MVVPEGDHGLLSHSVVVTLINRDGSDSPYTFRFKQAAELSFGSDADCDFVINRKGVQPQHCKLIIDNDVRLVPVLKSRVCINTDPVVDESFVEDDDLVSLEL